MTTENVWAVALTATLYVSGCSESQATAPRAAPPDAALEAMVATPETITVFERTRVESDASLPNFHGATSEVDFGSGPFSEVILISDLDTTCYPFERWQDNPPPPGQNWPADCDAFDRNYEFSLDDPASPGEPPGLELMRAITPFGGPLHLEVDITDVVNAHPGAHRIKVTIPSYSDGAGQVSGSNGGWFVSASVKLTRGPMPRPVIAAESLYYDSLTDPNPPALAFDLPEGTTRARLEYRVTGHGGVTLAQGCGLNRPAEEFCARLHTLSADGEEIAQVTPWRADCAELCTIAHQDSASGGFDYCLENPCGAIESVRAPRANWCPGSLTPPLEYEPDAWRSAGNHQLSFKVADIAMGGSWRTSATVFAYSE